MVIHKIFSIKWLQFIMWTAIGFSILDIIMKKNVQAPLSAYLMGVILSGVIFGSVIYGVWFVIVGRKKPFQEPREKWTIIQDNFLAAGFSILALFVTGLILNIFVRR